MIIKPYLPKKDQVDIAESIIKVFDEHGMIDEDAIRNNIELLDNIMEVALGSHFGIEELEEDFTE